MSNSSVENLFTDQEQLISQLLSDTDAGQVFVIDKSGTYTDLAKQLRGEVLHLQPGGNVFINPLEMRAGCDPVDDNLNDLIWRADVMCAFFQWLIGEDHIITPKMRSVIDAAVKELYQSVSDHGQAFLPDLLEVLKKDASTEGKILTDAVRVFTKEQIDCFSRPSNTKRDTGGGQECTGAH